MNHKIMPGCNFYTLDVSEGLKIITHKCESVGANEYIDFVIDEDGFDYDIKICYSGIIEIRKALEKAINELGAKK